MTHIEHIANNKKRLELRFVLTRQIREFFWQKNFLEVETPLIVNLPGQEPYLSPLPVVLHNEKNETYRGYLHTSPEYTMKKMLAAGFQNIFFIGKCFRDYESFGGQHNPEFTMIEWYRANTDFWSIMDDVENLLNYLIKFLKENEILNNQLHLQRIHMRGLWKEYVGVNLDDYLSEESMRRLCQEKKYNIEKKEKYENLFYRIFLNEIEPYLGTKNPTIVHHYPAAMAALAKLSDSDPRYAERFEFYFKGMEIANAFSELTDAVEQRRRLIAEKDERKILGKPVYDVDGEFLSALSLMLPSAGIALGVDRLVMALASCENIDDVIVLPASKLFKS